MPANDFEKKVQQKMDELQLRPSPSVWSEVEKQIRQDKRRRRVIIFWWLLPILLAGGVTTFLLTRNNDNKIADTAQITTTNTTSKSNNNPSATNSTNTNSSSTATTAPNNNIPITPNVNNSSTSTVQNGNDGFSSEVFIPNTKRNNKANREISRTVPVTSTNETTTKPAVEEVVELPVITQNSNPSTVETPTGQTDKKIIEAETITRQEKKADTVTSSPPSRLDSLMVVQPETKPDQQKNINARKKWQFGLEVKPGISTTWQGKLFGSAKSELLYATPTNVGSSPGPVLTPGPLAPPILIESPSSGASLGLEVFATRKISRKFDIRLGLEYQYLTTSIKVGEHVSAERQVTNDMSSGLVINGYYRAVNPGAQDRRYTNHYHLAGLKAGLAWNLINKRKFSLSWENYVAVNQLLGTNALLFDANLRSYYKDFDAFRKTQFIVGTGLSVPVLHGRKFTLSLNPAASYGLTPVLKSGSELNSHFLNYGLGIRFNFTGK